MRHLLFIWLLLPFMGRAQPTGSPFEGNIGWQEVLDKAKAAGKMVFVDCYASWCATCKQMDSAVYRKDSVKNFLGLHYIAIKFQMDTTANDNEEIKKRYRDAHELLDRYKISAYPTYLIFSSDGEVVHRGQGYMEVNDLIAFGTTALDSKKQYYTLLKKYENGGRDTAEMRCLALTAQKLDETNTANAVASDYINHFLFRLPPEEIYTKRNIGFITQFYELLHSKSLAFNLFYTRGDRVDTVMEDKGYARQYVDYVIYKEQITPSLHVAENESSDPNWRIMADSIRLKYGATCANRNILNAQISWYKHKRNYGKYARYLVRKVENYGVGIDRGVMKDFYLNNYAFEVFKYSKDVRELRTALSWSDQAIADDGNPAAEVLDTRANLLYKLGRRREAIAVEEKASSLDPSAKDIRITLEKMTKGEKTWPEIK
jgi:thiol-disulfide isomerase/thioredoxin